MATAQTVIKIRELFERFGQNDYDGEPVSQSSHMIQCAMFAMEYDPNDSELILGALLHDIGHLIGHAQGTESMAGFGAVDHEKIGSNFLKSNGFCPRICATVRHHVDAKRYLVATDAGYAAKLSPASQETLKWQGGPMTECETEEFARGPYFADIIRVRLWDEKAKDPEARVLPFESFVQRLEDHLG